MTDGGWHVPGICLSEEEFSQYERLCELLNEETTDMFLREIDASKTRAQKEDSHD